MWPILWASLAHAHIPHTIVDGVAVPAHDPDLPWILATQCEAPTAVYASLDRGSTWTPLRSPAMEDDLVDGAYTDDGIAVLLGEGRYFWTADTTTWIAEPLDIAPTLGASSMAGGDQLYFATPDGVYEVSPGGAPVQAMAGVAFQSVHEGDGGPVAITAEGRVWWRRDGVWTPLSIPPLGLAFAATSVDGEVWVGTDIGSVFAWTDDGWSTCGDVPLGTEDGPHREITRLDARDGRLLVTRADEGPAVSLDGCATFSASLAPNHNDWPEDRIGAYTTAEKAWVALVGVGDTLFAAGYDGASVSEDGGATWHIAPVVGADYTEGIALSPTFDADGEALLATYASGVTRAHAFGASFDAPGLGFRAGNGQDVAIATDAADVSPAYAVLNTTPFTSLDGGATWAPLTGPFEAVRLLQVGAGARVYGLAVSSTEDAPGALIVSDDHGATWSSFATLPATLASDTVTALLDRPGWLCAAGNLSVACSSDAGASWTTVHTVHSPTARVEAIALWPDDAPERLLVSDTLGLYRYDGAETQLRDTATPTWPLLATADDGTVFGVDVTGQLYTSADGGDTFVASAVTLPTQTRAMVPRPDFAAHPDLFLGTLDGTFVVRGDTVERYANLQRVDDGAQFVLCEACTSVDDAAAVLGQHSELAVNSWIEGNLRGTRLAVIGAAPAGAVVRVTVDEVEQGSFTVDPSEDITGELWSADGWTDGWHRVRVRVDVGTVDVDALEARGPSAELDHDATGDTGDTASDTGVDTGGDTAEDTAGDTDDTASDSGSDTSGDTSQDTAADTGRPKPDGGCGCGTTGRGAGWAAVLLGALGVRRRRAG